jgi:hypothetical protein
MIHENPDPVVHRDQMQKEVYDLSEDLVASPEHKKAASTLLDFDGLLDPPLKLHEDLRAGCGGQLWPAGMVLSKYLLRKDIQEFKHENMWVPRVWSSGFWLFHTDVEDSFELGAGGGLVG